MEQQSQYCNVHGDSTKPNVQITDIQWHNLQEKLFFSPTVVDTSTYINGSTYPVDKVFDLSWSAEEKQSTTWSQQWNIGKSFECEVELPDSSCTLKISYNHMCDTSTTSVHLSSRNSIQETIAPRKTAIASLELLASDFIKLSFTATIKYVDDNEKSSEYKMEGLWSGILYKLSSSNIKLKQTELGIL